MKKAVVTISFDEEKLSAIRLYMAPKGQTLEEAMNQMLEGFYAKFVPANVRDFIGMRDGQGQVSAKPRKPRGKQAAEDAPINMDSV